VLTVSSSPARQFFTIFGVVVAVVGLISLVGRIMRRTSRRMHGPAERAQGKIVGLDTSTRAPCASREPLAGRRLRRVRRERPALPTLVQFTTTERPQITATSSFGTNPTGPRERHRDRALRPERSSAHPSRDAEPVGRLH
jgi:hypothetical protein